MRERNERMLYYDLLRIIAAFSVVMLHSSAQFWYELDVRSTEWIIANAYDAVFRFGVPIFVMISGAIFLDTDYELNIRRLYRHNILRMVILYIVWSCVYGLYDSRSFDVSAVGMKPVLREMIMGRYHLWFIPMIVGIYVLLPILKGWLATAEKKTIEYFLGLFLVLKIICDTLRAWVETDELHSILDMLDVEMVCSYVGYFVLGYYLVHFGISKKVRNTIYALFVPAAMVNIVAGTRLSWRVGEADGSIYDSFTLFTFLMVIAIFVFVKEKGSKCSFGGRSTKVIRELSADTLGIYLLHIGVMEILRPYGVHSMMLPNIVGIPLFSILCFVICMLIAAVLRRIPVIGRYLC